VKTGSITEKNEILRVWAVLTHAVKAGYVSFK